MRVALRYERCDVMLVRKWVCFVAWLEKQTLRDGVTQIDEGSVRLLMQCSAKRLENNQSECK